MHKKLLALIFISLIGQSHQVFGQTFIPYASEQPKWFMPIYVQDATGMVDTTYYSYDPDATPGMDSDFGERYLPENNQGVFTTYVMSNWDSIVKVSALDSNSFVSNSISQGLVLVNATFPIKIWWGDINNLRSDSLPFPVPAPGAPRAQMIINIGMTMSYVTNPNGGAGPDGDVLITDTIIEPGTPITDTLYLSDFFNNQFPQSTTLLIEFQKWIGKLSTSIAEHDKNEKFIFYPNPAKDIIFIPTREVNLYSITDLTGRELIRGECTSYIDVSSLHSGVFILTINDVSASILIKR